MVVILLLLVYCKMYNVKVFAECENESIRGGENVPLVLQVK